MNSALENTSSQIGNKQFFGQVCNTGQALVIAESAQRFAGISVVITKSTNEASFLHRAISFFLVESDIPTIVFPDWETLPYDIFSPHQDIISDRLQILTDLPKLKQAVLIVPLPTLMHRLAPIEFLASRHFDYQVDATLDRDHLHKQLTRAGYQRVETVYEHGEYAFRGSIIDIFPMGEKTPFRIDLLDNDIESLRIFDPETQRTLNSVDNLRILPAREFPLDKEGINQFLNNWHDHFEQIPTDCPIYQDIKKGIAPQGIEYYLSLFFENTATLFDYLPEQTHIFTQFGLDQSAQSYWQDINRRYQEYGVDPQRPLLPPKQLFIPAEEIFSQLKQQPVTRLHKEPEKQAQGHQNICINNLPDISVNPKLTNPLEKLQDFLNRAPATTKVLFCAESAGRREVLNEILNEGNFKPPLFESWQQFITADDSIGITVYPLDRGFHYPERDLCLITEGELFGQQVMQRRRRSAASESPDYIFKSLAELKIGAPVVHIEHGVGRYCGLITLEMDGSEQEFLTLSYADDAKLYVPVSSLHLISRFKIGRAHV